VERYRCTTHGVVLIVEGKRRSFHNPQGSYAGMPQCQLHLMAQPEAKTIGECQIVKEESQNE